MADRGHAKRRARGRWLVAAALGLIAWAPTPAGAVVGSTPDRAFPTNGTVDAIAPADGARELLGGAFDRVGPTSPYFGEVNLGDGLPRLGFAAPNQGVQAVVSDGAGGWFVGGSFTSVGGIARGRLAHLLADGSVDPAFDPEIDPGEQSTALGVNALLRVGNRLYAGGQFSTVNGTVVRNSLAAFDATTGAVDPAFDPNIGGATRSVRTLALSGGRLYVGGDFATVNGSTARPDLAAVDATTGAVDAGFVPNVIATNTLVLSLAVVGSRLYAGGSGALFGVTNGTATRTVLVALDAATAALDPTFDPRITTTSGDGAKAEALAVSGGRLYVGGEFTTVNDTTRNGVAAVDLATGAVDPAFDPDIPFTVPDRFPFSGYVGALAISGSTLYVGGLFNRVQGGVVRNKLAAFDLATGAVTAFDPDVGEQPGGFNTTGVRALAIADGRLAFGGLNTLYVGGARNNVAAVGADGLLDQSLDPDVNGPVYAMVRSGTKLYLGGAFTMVNGTVARSGLAAVDVNTGAVDPLFLPPVVGTVRSLVLSGDTLYAGGSFALEPSSLGFGNLAALDATTGAVDPGFTPRVGGEVRTLLLAGTKLYLGGAFELVNDGVPRDRIAAVDAATGLVGPAFDPSAGNAVNALALAGGVLYVGGEFALMNTNAAQVLRNHLAAVDPATGVATSFDPNIGGDVYAVAVSGATVYAGGSFATVNGETPRSNLAAFNGGIADPGFVPGGGAVHALAVAGNTLQAGGDDGLRQFSQAGAPPVATTGAASAITGSGASIAGAVNPSGAATAYVVEYGTSTALGAISEPASAGTGSDDVALTASLDGLSADTVYVYRVVATSPAGTAFGAVRTFKTAGGTPGPTVATLAASAVGTTTATLNAQINPDGERTVFTFEYGPSLAFGAISGVVALDEATALEPVSAALTGLQPNTTYAFRVVATSPSGTTTGAVMRFSTTGPGAPPGVDTGAAGAIGPTSATLGGTVDAHGIATVFTFAYGTSSANLGSITAVDNADPTVNGPQSVTLPATGLQPDTTYVYRLIATNARGTSLGPLRTFTTGAAS